MHTAGGQGALLTAMLIPTPPMTTETPHLPPNFVSQIARANNIMYVSNTAQYSGLAISATPLETHLGCSYREVSVKKSYDRA